MPTGREVGFPALTRQPSQCRLADHVQVLVRVCRGRLRPGTPRTPARPPLPRRSRAYPGGCQVGAEVRPRALLPAHDQLACVEACPLVGIEAIALARPVGREDEPPARAEHARQLRGPAQLRLLGQVREDREPVDEVGRLRLLPLAQPLVLGLPPLPALQPRRAPDRLRARTGKRIRASHRRRTARASTRARPNRDLRQRLCRRRLRTAHPFARRHHPAPRPQRRTTPLRLTRRHPPTRSSRRSTPSKTDSHSNATAAAPSPASSAESHDGYSPSPPSSSHDWQLGTPGRNLTAYDH